MDRNLAMDAVRVTEAAALASARTMGLGDLHRAEEAAVQAMRQAFDSLDIRGTVVIGEGSEAEVPVIYVGERVGHGRDSDPEVELAADPLEGSRLCARGMPNAMSVIAMVRGGHFLRVPDTYMYKIAVGARRQGRHRSEPTHSVEPELGGRRQGRVPRGPDGGGAGPPPARGAHPRDPGDRGPHQADPRRRRGGRPSPPAATRPASTC
jgi:hypothetical protein